MQYYNILCAYSFKTHITIITRVCTGASRNIYNNNNNNIGQITCENP